MNDVMGEASGSISSSNGSDGNCGAGSSNGNTSNNNNNNNNGNNLKASTIGANGGERISAAVTKVLQGYDWTLVPVATK